ncbi:MAG: 50S ribosomal protein L7ae [Clostridiales bacterium]|nr:50S ribosomal protein L7ae [Clostridiales bacterium]
MKKKVISYLGFAKKSGNLLSGVNTCTFAMIKGKVRLVILAEDISENSQKKILKEIRKHDVPYVKYGMSEELSHAIGAEGRSVFALCDDNFSNVILKEINEEVE